MAGGHDGLGDLAARLDAERFVGRAAALAVLAGAVDGTSSTRLIYLHGSAGVGKSALLRAMGRAAAAAGHEVAALDGRVIDKTPDGVAGALASAATARLVVIDEVDELGALARALRVALARLPATTVVVLAGRPAPGPEWFDGALEHLTAEVRVRPLDNDEGRELLHRRGLTDPNEVERLLAWAGGYPLALAVAASSVPSPGDEPPGRTAATGDRTHHLDEVILGRLAGRELDGIDPDVLDVAGVAPVVDGRLLTQALPGRSTRAGLAQLRALSVAEAVGGGVTLHRLVRSAVRTRLRETDPERYRTLVVRVADHLRTRALTDDPRAILELLDLIEDPQSRSGYGPSASNYVDRARPGDAARAGEVIGATGTAWWGRFTRWCDERPEQVVVVRTRAGEPALVGIVCTLDRMPAWAEQDIEVGPVVAHLRTFGGADQAVFVHDIHNLQDPSDDTAYAEAVRVGNAGAFALSGMANPRYLYVTAPFVRSGDGSEAMGYGEVESLRRRDDERQLVTTAVDHGPGGAVGGIHAMVRTEQLGSADEAPSSDRGERIVAALRAFHDHDALAAGRLGEGEGAGRVASARQEVRDAVAAAFAGTEPDRMLRQALERTYLADDGGHAVARAELHMSRSAFYRHLQKARDRLAASAR